MLKKQLLLVLAMVATTFAISGTGYAAENKDDYTVNIEAPATQAPRSTLNGYFDLVLAPNQT